jgi:polysaccharide biosynthesis protein PslH
MTMPAATTTPDAADAALSGTRTAHRRPRILYVCSIWPVDRAYGGQIRTLHIARALQQLGDVSLALVGAEARGPDVKAATAQEFAVVQELGTQRLQGGAWQHWWRALANTGFVNIHGMVVDVQSERDLLALMPQFDLIWFSRLRTANYLGQARWPQAVIDIDDLPSVIEASTARTQHRWRARGTAWLRTALLRLHERRLPQRFGHLLVCSEADRARLPAAHRARVHVVPNGYARLASAVQPAPVMPLRIGFIGLFDYLPNLDGVRWFVSACLPLIQQQVPGVRLRLVGSQTDGPLRPDHAAVDGLGWVDDAAAEISTWSLMIVPVRIGGGTRIKIAEAFSRGCPVVSTSHGAYGYEVQDGVELRLADTAAAFAQACVWALTQPAAAAAMAQRAHQVFLQRWTWDAIAQCVHAVARQAMRTTPSTAAPISAPGHLPTAVRP